MAIRCFVLVETTVGKAKDVREILGKIPPDGGRILQVDTVTGPYDIILLLEANNLDLLGTYITETIQKSEGVQRTITCLSVRL